MDAESNNSHDSLRITVVRYCSGYLLYINSFHSYRKPRRWSYYYLILEMRVSVPRLPCNRALDVSYMYLHEGRYDGEAIFSAFRGVSASLRDQADVRVS